MNVTLQDRPQTETSTGSSNGDLAAQAPLHLEVEQGAVVVDLDTIKEEHLAVWVRQHCRHADCVLGMTSSRDAGELQRLLLLGLHGVIPAGADPQTIDCALSSARHQASKAHELKLRVTQLERKLEDRIVIERAKGVIASRAQIDEEEALRRLRREARNQRRSMREVAQSLLDADRMLKTSSL